MQSLQCVLFQPLVVHFFTKLKMIQQPTANRIPAICTTIKAVWSESLMRHHYLLPEFNCHQTIFFFSFHQRHFDPSSETSREFPTGIGALTHLHKFRLVWTVMGRNLMFRQIIMVYYEALLSWGRKTCTAPGFTDCCFDYDLPSNLSFQVSQRICNTFKLEHVYNAKVNPSASMGMGQQITKKNCNANHKAYYLCLMSQCKYKSWCLCCNIHSAIFWFSHFEFTFMMSWS